MVQGVREGEGDSGGPARTAGRGSAAGVTCAGRLGRLGRLCRVLKYKVSQIARNRPCQIYNRPTPCIPEFGLCLGTSINNCP